MSALQRWRGDAAALVCGAALPAAFAPLNWYPLAVLALAGLFLTWRHVPATRAFRRGLLFGLGAFGVGTSWVIVSIHEFGHTPIPLAALVTVLLVAFLALYPAGAGFIVQRWFGSLRAAHYALVAAAVWGLTDWLRGWFLTGFPWLGVGSSQVDGPLAGLAPVLGVHGLTVAVAVSGALIAVWREFRPAGRLLSLAAFAVLWIGSGGLKAIDWVQAGGAPLQVALLQGNVSQDLKWRPDQRQKTLQHYEDLTRSAFGSDLVIWPETAIPAFYHEVIDNYLMPLAAAAREHGTELLIGVPVKSTRDGRYVYYNSILSLGADTAFYHKRHLVPFGEFVPFGNLLRRLGGVFNLPMSDFANGGYDQPLLEVAGHKVGISICYEDVFPNEVRQALPAASLLVNVSNDAWFGDSLAPHQHLQMARLRAIEGGRPMLRATNTGISALIDHRGQVIARSPQFEVAVLRGRVQPMRGATPYARFGDLPVLLALAVVLVVALPVRGRRVLTRA